MSKKLLSALLLSAVVGFSSFAQAEEAKITKITNEQLTAIAKDVDKAKVNAKDPNVQLQDVVAGDQLLTYKYKIMDKASTDYDKAKAAESLKSYMVQNGCGSKDFTSFLNAGVSLQFVYNGKDDLNVADIKLAPADCKK